ncbi:MAG TPA: nuclear transport factor 2 family protein [Pyrinomonadaceae bacterium]|jgi:ketosteroid isomerase-like protein
MKKLKVGSFYLAACLVLCSPLFAQNSKKQNEALEQEIRRLDLAEAEAILKKDFQALDKLTGEDFTTNSPRNEIVKGKESLKELMRKGVVDYASFTRETEAVLIYGKTVVTMGRETIVMSDASPQKGQTIRRRYTNVWMKRNDKWLLTARHANIICQ